MAKFDTIAKHLIQTYPADFARFALQRDDIEDVIPPTPLPAAAHTKTYIPPTNPAE